MWFLCALITMLMWGAADLFYKKGADETDRYSHLKTSVAVGAVMGVHAIGTLLFTDVKYDFRNIYLYFPVSFMYILSMTVGYLGLRYLELSVSSPIQNSSGAVTCLLCVIFLGQGMDGLSAAAVALICAGVFALGIFERQRDKQYIADADRKYKVGFVAILLPVAYCVIDALGTFMDAYYLDDFASTPLAGVTEQNFETVANISYELTFLICAVVLFIYVRFIKKQSFAIKAQGSRGVAAIFETLGQFVYVYAMSGNAVVAAPMIAAYSIVSVLLSRLFIGERLLKRQYAAVCAVIAGIILLGVVEGLNE